MATESANVHVRIAKETDIDRMFEISVSAHTQGYDTLIPANRWKDFTRRFADTEHARCMFRKRVLSRIQSPDWNVSVAEIDDMIVGHSITEAIGKHQLYLRGIFVDPRWQGRGVGKILFEAKLRLIEKGVIRLTVLKENTRARLLYEEHGFADTTIAEKDFFGARQVVMELRKR